VTTNRCENCKGRRNKTKITGKCSNDKEQTTKGRGEKKKKKEKEKGRVRSREEAWNLKYL
jgi:hypothetical protein